MSATLLVLSAALVGFVVNRLVHHLFGSFPTLSDFLTLFRASCLLVGFLFLFPIDFACEGIESQGGLCRLMSGSLLRTIYYLPDSGI